MSPPAGKHTPGPWSVWEAAWPGIDGQDGSTIILYGNEGEDDGVHGSTDEEAQANARLIAASPDLLAACRAALPWVAIATAPGGEFRGPQSSVNAAADLALLRAAIAKAEGREG